MTTRNIDDVFEPLIAQAMLNMASRGLRIINTSGSDITPSILARASTTNDGYDAWVDSHGSEPTLDQRLQHYLSEREHVLSTAHLSGMRQLLAEADYVVGEAKELRLAIEALADAYAARDAELIEAAWTKVYHEIADVTLADTTLAGFCANLRPGLTVENCIVQKTIHDKGRG